uniref:ABC transporter ATP-binding protein n=1 Tax=Thermorudis peleae TaxID=1382356 RepID=A0A831T8R2_9BACT
MPEALLTVRDLWKEFDGIQAVRGFELDLYPGEVVGLIGPNGAGKSTVVNLLSGFHRPSRGRITFAGHDISQARPDRIARLGLVRTFQHIRLFSELTVRQNVEVAAAPRLQISTIDVALRTRRYRREVERWRQEVDELLEASGLMAIQDRPAGVLPYGDQRRVEIIRALATQPRALLLDEPAAGMNESEAAALSDFLEWAQGRYGLSLVLIEHHLDVVERLCQRVIVMDQGAIIASGTPEEVTQHREVIRAYLGEAA